VLVAARDIAIGEKLAAGSVIWKEWPKDLVRDVMITRDERPEAETELGESRALIQMFEGETVMEKKVVAAGEGGVLSAVLPKGMRAYSLPIKSWESSGGFILPNDRVDVLLTRKMDAPGGGALHKSEIILTNARVLTVNQVFNRSSEEEEASVKDVDYVAIELKPEQAEILARLESEGDITLALRSLADDEGKGASEGPVLAEKYRGDGKSKPPTGDTLFVRFGVETYGATR
jgi:pilus assembly protein CpaB